MAAAQLQCVWCNTPAVRYWFTVVQRKPDPPSPITFSNDFNKYWPVSIIFSRQNLQRVSNASFVAQKFVTKSSTSLG